MRFSCIIYDDLGQKTQAKVSVSYKDQLSNLSFEKRSKAYRGHLDVTDRGEIIFFVKKKGFVSVKTSFILEAREYQFFLARSNAGYIKKGDVIRPIPNYSGVYGIMDFGRDKQAILDEFGLEVLREHNGEKVTGSHLYVKKQKFLTRKSDSQKEKIFKTDLAKLRKRLGQNSVGQVLDLTKSKRVYGSKIKIRFQPKTSLVAIKRLIAECEFELIRKTRGGMYVVDAGSDCGIDEIQKHIEELSKSELVKSAIPLSVMSPEPNVVAGNFLAGGQYTHKVMEVPEAWEALKMNKGVDYTFGIGDILVGVSDFGLTPVGGAQNPSFMVEVKLSTGGTEDKICTLQDFRSTPHVGYPLGSFGPNNDAGTLWDGVISNHGVNVCGVILASATDGVDSSGIAGVAPETRLISLIAREIDDDLIVNAFGWAAGLYEFNDGINFLSMQAKGFDLMGSSTGYKYPSTVEEEDEFKILIDDLLTYGRNGKGTLLIFAAGNDNKVISYVEPTLGSPQNNYYATYNGVLSIGATSFYNDYNSERKTRYSNTGKIDFCAPSNNSGSGYDDLHSPVSNIHSWSATRVGSGDLPGGVLEELTVSSSIIGSNSLIQSEATIVAIPDAAGPIPSAYLTADFTIGMTAVQVTTTDGFFDGMIISLKQVAGDIEFVKITTVSELTLNIDPSTPLTNDYLSPMTNVKGYTTVSDIIPGDYSVGEQIDFELINHGRTTYETVRLVHISGSILGFTHPSTHNLSAGSVVGLRRNPLVSEGYLDSSTFPANYAPTGSPTSDISSNGNITIVGESNFVSGTMIFIESDSGDFEWVIVESTTPPPDGSPPETPGVINIHPDTPIINDYLMVDSPTIKGYPTILVFNPSPVLSPGQKILVTRGSFMTTYRAFMNGAIAVEPSATMISTGGTEIRKEISIQLLSVGTLAPNDVVLLGKPEFNYTPEIALTEINEKSEVVKITHVLDDENKIIVERILNDHSTPIKIYKGALDYDSQFSGTSSACPSVTGVVALMLSANPDLTWIEIIDLLRKSSDKIDKQNKGYELPASDDGHQSADGDILGYSASLADETIRPAGQGRWKNKAGEYIYGMDGTLLVDEVDAVPYFSEWYGYGRVNAKNAVNLALAYSQNNRDLVIRDTMTDDGTTGNPVDLEVNSPDVWIRNIDPDLDTFDYPGLDYATAGPHQNPLKYGDRYVYARIKNIGTLDHSLEAKVRFFAVLDVPGTDYKFPDHFTEKADVSEGEIGVKLIGEIELSEEYFAPGEDHIFNVLWSKDDSDVNSEYETSILVEVTPHDGPYFDTEKEGASLGDCNNITRKPIVFQEDIEILGVDQKFPYTIGVPSEDIESPISTSFQVMISDLNAFVTENTVVKLIINRLDATTEEVEFIYEGGSWGFNIPPTDSWATLDPPLKEPYGPANLATGDMNSIIFNGTFSIDGTVDNVTISASYENSDTEMLGKQRTVDVNVYSVPVPGTEDDPIEKNTVYFFTEFDLLNSPQVDAYGPVPSDLGTIYQTTSKHTATANCKAFGVTDGQIMVQETSNPLLVNVILKPKNQGAIDFLDIKYFIYRGILKADLIDGVDDDLIAPLETSEFIDSMWETQDAINAAIEDADEDDGITPGSILDKPSSKSFGIHYKATTVNPGDVEKSDLATIDDLFFDASSNYRFPTIKAGQQIGHFDKDEIGFDIILNGMLNQTTFGQVRGSENRITAAELDGSESDLECFVNRSQRAEILNYLDPAAFYGIHIYSGINAINSSEEDKLYIDNKDNDPYDSLISLFKNKNLTYIDIRNENGYNYNYYDSYNDVDGNQIKFSFDELVPTSEQVFGTHGWPIRIVENDELASGETGKKNTFWIELPKGNNLDPLLYMPFAASAKRFPKLPKRKKKFLTPEFLGANIYSEPIELGLPNKRDEGDTTAIAWYVKLTYIKKNRSDNTPVNTLELNSVHSLDHVFPLVDLLPWDSTNNIKYLSGFHSRFVQRDDFSFIGETGIAIESDRVFLFSVPEQIYQTSNKKQRFFKRILGGTSNKNSFFEVFQNSVPDLILEKKTLTIDGVDQDCLLLEDRGLIKEAESTKNNFFCIGLTKVEFDAFIAAGEAVNLDISKHYPSLIIAAENVLSDDNDQAYLEYDLKISGINSSGEYVEAPLVVKVHSVDGIMLTSQSFILLETLNSVENECIQFDHEINSPKHNTGVGQIIKRVSLYVKTNGEVIRSWKLYNRDASIATFEGGEIDNFNVTKLVSDEVEIPVGTRCVMLECEGLPILTHGSIKFVRIVCWYAGVFHEGYIHESAFLNSSSVRSTNPEGLTNDEIFESFVNDARLDLFLAKEHVASGQATLDDSFQSILTDISSCVDPVGLVDGPYDSGASLIEKYVNGSVDTKNQIADRISGKIDRKGLVAVYYADGESGRRFSFPDTIANFIALMESLDLISASASKFDFFPLTHEMVPGNGVDDTVFYDSEFAEYFAANCPNLHSNMQGNSGSTDEIVTEFTNELKLIRDWLTDKKGSDPARPILHTPEAKWFLADGTGPDNKNRSSTGGGPVTPEHPEGIDYFDFLSIQYLQVVHGLTIKNPGNPNHVETDFLAPLIFIDQSFGTLNSNNILSVFIHEMYMRDLISAYTNTHGLWSEVPEPLNTSLTKLVAETAWEYVKDNDFADFFAHGLAPNPAYTDENGKKLSSGYRTDTILDFLQRNPFIGVIYLKAYLDEILKEL